MNKLLVAITFLLLTLVSTFSCGNNQNADISEEIPQVSNNTKSENVISRAYLDEITDNIEIQFDKSCEDISNIVAIDNNSSKLFIKKIHGSISDIPAKENLIIYLLDRNGFIKYTLVDAFGRQSTPSYWNVNTVYVTCTNNKAIASNIFLKNSHYKDKNKNLIPDNLEDLFEDNNQNGQADLIDGIENYLTSKNQNFNNTRFGIGVGLLLLAPPVDYILSATVATVTSYLIVNLGEYIYEEFTDVEEHPQTYVEEYPESYTENQPPSKPKDPCDFNNLAQRLYEINQQVPQIKQLLDDLEEFTYNHSCDICTGYHIVCYIENSKLYSMFSPIVRRIACAYMRYKCSETYYSDNKDKGHCQAIFENLKKITNKVLKELKQNPYELKRAIKEIKKIYEDKLRKKSCFSFNSISSPTKLSSLLA